MRSVALLGVLLVLLAVARPVHAQTEAHNEVTQAMEAFRQASLANDADRLDALMADDCTVILVTGRLVMKPQFLAVVRGGSLAIDAFSYDDVAVRIYGNTAVVTHILHIKERISGAPVTGRFRSTRVLLKGDRGWRFVAIHSTGT